MKARLQSFFMNRNGADDFCKFLSIASLIFMFLGYVQSLFTSIGLAFLVLCLFRMLSRNLYKRSAENDAYLRMRGNVTGWFDKKKSRFSQLKTHRFYKCPECKQELRVPKGKGKISITCPKCNMQFIKKS